jgi:hypothetical protein
LDIDVVTRGRWWADGGKYRDELATYDPYRDGLPEEIEQKQIEHYVELFKLFDENSDIIERVSFWNLHDGQSWLNYFPWRRVNYPLLFDRNRRPKPAFDAVYKSLRTTRLERRSNTPRVIVPINSRNFRASPAIIPSKEARQGRDRLSQLFTHTRLALANGLREGITTDVLDKIAQHAAIKLMLKSFWHEGDARIAKLFDLGSVDRFTAAVGKRQGNGFAGFVRYDSRQRTAICRYHNVGAILWFYRSIRHKD